MRDARPLIAASVLASFAVAAPTRASAADLYVAETGNDANPGTEASPWQTIGKCAAMAMPGDTCRIASGKYRELVKPPRSGAPGKPVSFVAASTTGAPVVITGRRPITGFSLHDGAKIWKATVTADFTELFVDDASMVIARTPNLTSGDVYRPTFDLTGAAGGTTYIVDPTHLTQPAKYWDGAKLFLVPGLGWSADQATVTAWDPVAHRIDFTPAITFASPTYTADKETRYYLYDKLSLLDAPSEWFLDRAAHVVYLWLPDGGDPNKHVVEAATSPAGFDLADRAEIQLQGLTIASGELSMTNATHCTVDGTRVLYAQSAAGSGFSPGGLVDVSGSDNLITRSEIAYAPERCVYLGGTRNTLRSSHVHHCDAHGSYAQIVKVGGKGNTVEDCSLHDTGRDGIGTEDKGIDGSVIAHNELHDTCLIAKDCGGFYAYMTDGGGTAIRYNVVHDVWPAPTEAYGGVHLGMGIYFDDGDSNFVADHNVVYKIGHNGIFLHQPSRNIHVYNNTTVGSGGGRSSALDTAPGNGGNDATGSLLENNLAVLLDDRDGWCIGIEGAKPAYDHNGYFQASGKGRNNSVGVEPTAVVSDPLFDDAASARFTLRATSPMIDKGVVVTGITDGFVGAAPDLGAYEYGGKEAPGPRGPVGPPSPPTTTDGGVDADATSSSDGAIVDDASADAETTSAADSTIDLEGGDGGPTSGDSASASSGGCGCRVGGERGARGVTLLMVTAALMLARRRRRAC